jgi:hypothetical protein
MALTPVFDPLAVFRAAEVDLVLGPLEPAALTGGFAVLAAVGFGAVALVAQVAPIRLIKLAAVQALTPARSLHEATQKGEPSLVQDSGGKGRKSARQPKKNQQNEEKFLFNAWKKKRPSGIPFSNRWIYRSFRSSLTIEYAWTFQGSFDPKKTLQNSMTARFMEGRACHTVHFEVEVRRFSGRGFALTVSRRTDALPYLKFRFVCGPLTTRSGSVFWYFGPKRPLMSGEPIERAQQYVLLGHDQRLTPDQRSAGPCRRVQSEARVYTDSVESFEVKVQADTGHRQTAIDFVESWEAARPVEQASNSFFPWLDSVPI